MIGNQPMSNRIKKLNIAVIGHGAMGRLVESLALVEGHVIRIAPSARDGRRDVETLSEWLTGSDVAIDFTVADAVLTNVEACARAKVPLVEGTTGWKERQQEVMRIIEEQDGALVYGANFSVGVNLFYRVVGFATELFSAVEGYDAFIEEAHHKRKRDAPSGTALALKEIMHVRGQAEVPVSSTRAGYIPGTHRVGFDSAADQITLTHTARSREGFAAGALFAARWIVGRKGIYEFSDVLDDYLKERVKRT
jgi:4-hydroxy-tetrahydrodipicolinate reductase